MRLLPVLGIMILLISLASAEEISDLFASGDAMITPPSISDPEAEDSLNNLNLTLLDISSGEAITNAHVRIFLSDGTTLNTLRFVDDGKVTLQLSSATWGVTLKLDKTETSGMDYYSKFDVALTGDRSITAYMRPVGSFTGEVIDSGGLVTKAQIKFDCIGDYGETGETISDSFGSFSADWLPVGSCKVSALSDGKVGSSEVIITQGEISKIEILLEKEISKSEDYSWLIIPMVLILAVLIYLFLRKRGPAKKESSKKIKPDKHMSDILSALDENEKKIVEFLMAGGGKSQQNKIGRELGFPKASLSRALGALEARDLVKTEKLGRLKRVELSDWFLNGKKA
jgi:DNA-binding MarR family transcriptional regulator